jgi:hypothetical protein
MPAPHEERTMRDPLRAGLRLSDLHRRLRLPIGLALATTLLAAPGLQAVDLVFHEPVVEGEARDEAGQRSEIVAPRPEEPAGADAVVSLGNAASLSLTPEAPGFCVAFGNGGTFPFTLAPGAGEAVGDCVELVICQTAQLAVSRAAANQGAEAGYGGPAFTEACAGTGNPTQIAFGSPAEVIRDPGGSPQTLYSQPAQVLQADAAPSDLLECVTAIAAIGDDFEIRLNSGVGVWTNPPHGTAAASSNTTLQITAQSCREPGIPAASPRGLALLAAGLAAAALATLVWRRRRA